MHSANILTLIYIYIYILLVCLFVSNERQTAELTGLKFCVGPHMTPV